MRAGLTFARHSFSIFSNRGRLFATIFSLLSIVLLSITPVRALSTYDNDVLSDGAYGYWTLSNAVGDNSGLTDETSTANNMTEQNVTHGATAINAGASYSDSFNGTSSTASASSVNGSLYTAAQKFSVEAWIKPASIPSQGSKAGIAGKEGSYWLSFDGSHLAFDLSQSGDHMCDDPDSTVANYPYYLVGTYDGSTQKLYVNGNLVCSQSFTGNVDMSSGPVVAGSWDTSTNFYAGYLSNIAVYNTVLSTSQIAKHYTDGDARPLVQECGTLSSSQTWTPDNIYLATCQVEVPSGITLTIGSGVLVKYTSMGNIQVDSGGTLDVTGTTASPATFTSVNDNSIGGATGNGTPAVNDYSNAITMNGGAISVQHAKFDYAGTTIGDSRTFINSGSTVSVADSLFRHSTMAMFLTSSPLTLTLERNTFNVSGVGGPNGDPAIDVANDSDLTGIVLAGSNTNTFVTGNDPASVTFSILNSTVPSGSTWEIDSSASHAIMSTTGNSYGPGVTVNGTLTLDSGAEWENFISGIGVYGSVNIQQGAVIKSSQGTGLQINAGGVLNITGITASPATFTSINDNSIGGATGNGTPAANDYTNAITMNGGTVSAQFAQFEYASTAIGDSGTFVSSGSSVTVTDSQFTNEYSAVNLYRSPATLVLARNNIAVSGTTGVAPIAISNDSDLSGISLAGSNTNTFANSGQGSLISILNSTVATGTTWEIDTNASHAVVTSTGNAYGAGVTVNGTLTLDSGAEWEDLNDGMHDLGVAVNGIADLASGVIVKNQTVGWQVNAGGRLNVTGTSASHVVFTSINDNSIGGATGNGTPAANDYPVAIQMYGGTANMQYSTFEYAATDVGYLSGVSGSSLVVTDSSFENSIQGIAQSNNNVVELQRNNFDLHTSGANNSAILVTGDADLSEIILSGSDKNTFSGTGPNQAVIVDGSVPVGSTWTVGPDSQSVLVLDAYGTTYAVSVDGTVDIIPGEFIKVEGNGFDVQSDGILNAEGSASTPIVFTSYKDDHIGGDTNGDGSSSGSTGDYMTAARFEDPSSSDYVSYTVFKYASGALSIGIGGTLNVDNDQFTDNVAAFNADTTSTQNPVLGTLAPRCLWPYANSIHITNSWFGSTGEPGSSMDMSPYLGQTMPSGYSGLSQEYNYFTYMYPLVANVGDNTIPWTLFTCGIPDGPTVSFPVTDVNVPDFPSPAISSSELWTDPSLAE